MNAYDHLLDQDALYAFDLAWRAEIGEYEYPERIWDGDLQAYANPDPDLWARLEAAAEERGYERGEA